jgi:hypothetical protein
VAHERHYPNGPAVQDPHSVELAIRIRNASIDRMRMASARHGARAADVRNGGNRIGPHAVLFLYHDVADRDGAGARDVVVVSYRMFGDHARYREIPDVLRAMADESARYARQPGGFDPRRVLVHGVDEEVPAHATFVGVAVSTLDTSAGRWIDVRERVGGALDVAGRAYVLLVDGTGIVLERGGPFGVNGTTWSSHTLELDLGMATHRSWRQLIRYADDPDEAVWRGMDTLLWQVYRGIRARFAA